MINVSNNDNDVQQSYQVQTLVNEDSQLEVSLLSDLQGAAEW